jgi:Flavoprotein
MSDIRIVQHPQCACFTRRNEVGFVSREGTNCVYLSDQLARLAHEIWERVASPYPHDRLLGDLAAAGFPRPATESVLQVLRRERAVTVAAEGESAPRGTLAANAQQGRPCDRLLVCMTGAIQSADFNRYLYALKVSFCAELKIVLTESARKLVREEALLHLFSSEVYGDVFGPADDRAVPHIWLSEWASCILVAPASAATLHRLAHAACDDLTSLTVAATPPQTPVVVGPSMNPRMWSNRAVQENVERCRAQGHWVIEPGHAREVSKGWDEVSWEVGGFGAQPAELVKLMIQICKIHSSGAHGLRETDATEAGRQEEAVLDPPELTPGKGLNDAWNDESPS